ncbi:transcription factor CBF/NF-Y/histone domain-containing protein [Halodesulfurarchaeum formicicum]|uniref:Transcription factor CBF/NF-Y/histone domain-containing protein n=1 Tax=Halodesulfurarchaeum formicicum TaxID=1873524 RepID=A0A1D8S6H7_9EURY|nr:histone [Halodesulfurarchaeum formicicum]AOW80951.1 transcription factor CBF/NF-Y/histone domain-containing protein [Halodesulfurarchaeum formicicum]APE96285.1 transcription factor CBF/NF-Y/histone domain-containing protein [Halodesulfurarchaeum formicicum]
MSVELPFSPVDSLIRTQAGDLRVSAGAAEALAREIQQIGAAIASEAAQRAAAADRKTIMVSDFGDISVPERDTVTLPIAPVDRIARLEIDDQFRVAEDARLALAGLLESRAKRIANGARELAEHAGRRTIQAEDIELFVSLCD